MSNNKKNINLYLYYTSINRGPGAVVNNLIKGLQNSFEEYTVRIVSDIRDANYFGILQNPGEFYEQIPQQALIGPNIFVLPDEQKEICNKFDNFIVPSTWVRNKYNTFEILKNKNIDIWSVGIDTDFWCPDNNDEKELDCFIYYKNRSQQDLALVYKMCKFYKLKFDIIQYGSYEEQQLKNLCNKAKFAILLTNTESQGIAYMNILSMNLPCYVFDQSKWHYEHNKNIFFDATSVPYFEKSCGSITKDINLESFDEFLHNFRKNYYKPREYIVNNHSLYLSTLNYINLLIK